MTIGQRIKARREELNMSQEELAKRIGYKSRSSINKIELDLYELRQTKIKSIADALDTTPSYIMGWDEESFTSDINAKKPTPVSEDGLEDPLDKQLMEYVKSLTTDQKVFLLAQLKALIEQQ